MKYFTSNIWLIIFFSLFAFPSCSNDNDDNNNTNNNTTPNTNTYYMVGTYSGVQEEINNFHTPFSNNIITQRITDTDYLVKGIYGSHDVVCTFEKHEGWTYLTEKNINGTDNPITSDTYIKNLLFGAHYSGSGDTSYTLNYKIVKEPNHIVIGQWSDQNGFNKN